MRRVYPASCLSPRYGNGGRREAGTVAPMSFDDSPRTASTVWELGDYDRMSIELLAPLGAAVARAADTGPGDRVLDVGAGTGNVSLLLAATGARVTASDLTPALLDIGRRRAASRGLELAWRTADAQHLPFDDAAFDVVVSCVGVMFAPSHQRAADELLRVLRPGGRLVLANWTPGGFAGRLLVPLSTRLPTPPTGSSPAPLWGSAEHVAGLLGDRVEQFSATTGSLPVELFETPRDQVRYFRSHFGPMIRAFAGIADDVRETRRLQRELEGLAGRFFTAPGHMEWEYLLVTARRR